MTAAGSDLQQDISQRPLALTMGEPAGIGGEITLQTWLASSPASPPGNPLGSSSIPSFFTIDDPARLNALADTLGLAVPISVIETPADASAVFTKALPVLPMKLPKASKPGELQPENAQAVLDSIGTAVRLTLKGQAAAVVTNPIHKQVLYDAGFRHPGHTEYLAELAGEAQPPVMMLACPGLRVVPVTVHLSLAQAVKALSREAIVHAGTVTAAALRRDFAIDNPRLAVAGLNPHAGEGGALGREEIDIIIPAVDDLRRQGIDITGPAPADSLFHAQARDRYDAVLCMYHDQALIPLKTIDFERGVNITLGLPFVRTSPDHGTALDIAGQGKASPASLIAALCTARQMADARAAAR